jgi:hypothetical protein
MNKLLSNTNKVSILCFMLLGMLLNKANAQTDADAIMIPKNYFCAGAMYSNSSWSNYWEGTLKRNNLNLGTVNTNMYMAMANYGISDKLNVLVSLPYVTTNASAGTLSGQRGFQDIAGTLKWMPVETRLASGTFSLYAIGTYVLPLTNYVADFMPMSIGLHCRSFQFRAMVDYQYRHAFFTGSGQYINRNNISIDRTSYYTTTMIYSNQVALPNATVLNFRAGYRSESVIAEAVVESNTSNGGFDIRRNDMPFPSNRMNATAAGVNFKYSFDSGLELTAGSSYVLAGRNVGQSTMFHGGAYYLFDLNKRTKSSAK